MEHRGVGGVQLVGAEHTAGAGDVQRHATGQEATDLIGRGLGAQHHVGADEARGVLGLIALDVEGVLHLAGRMVRAEVQRVEVIPFGFHFRTVGNLPAHGDKEVLDILHQLRQRVAGAQRLAVDRQASYPRFRQQARGPLSSASLSLTFPWCRYARPKSARSLPMSLPASFFWSFGQRADGLAGLASSPNSAPAYCRLDGFQFLHCWRRSRFSRCPRQPHRLPAWASNTAPSATRYLSYQPFVLRIKRAIHSVFTDFTFFQHDST